MANSWIIDSKGQLDEMAKTENQMKIHTCLLASNYDENIILKNYVVEINKAISSYQENMYVIRHIYLDGWLLAGIEVHIIRGNLGIKMSAVGAYLYFGRWKE